MRPLSDIIYRLAPLAIWGAHFLTLYASESLLCTRGATQAHTTLATIATLSALVMLFIFGVRAFRPRVDADQSAAFLNWLLGALSIAAAGGVFATAFPILTISACRSARLALASSF